MWRKPKEWDKSNTDSTSDSGRQRFHQRNQKRDKPFLDAEASGTTSNEQKQATPVAMRSKAKRTNKTKKQN